MINKKILAASIAAAFTFNANAVVDLNTGSTALKYATETVANGAVIAANAAIDMKVDAGLNLPQSTQFFARFEFDNATVATSDVAAVDLTLGGATTPVITVEGGGKFGTDDDYVVFSFQDNGAAITKAQELALAIGTGGVGLTVTDNTKPVTVTYKLYEAADSLAALNGGAGEATSTTLAAITFASGQDVAKSFATNANTALVAKQFKEFAADTSPAIAAGKVASLGRADLTVKASTLSAASVQVVEADVFTTPTTTATVTGDFSFGKTWWMSAVADCSTPAGATNKLVIATTKASATVPSLDYTNGQSLCVEVSGTEVIPRNSTGYTVTLAANTGVAGTIGSITYDTTAITIPYVTTFSSYNQRVYILNNSSVAAPYTTTFQTEAGVTATAGTAATGTVPAKTLLAIKATDLVTFVGGTRGAAVIEIEATSTNIEATSQTVNKSTSGTDTTILEVQ